MLNGFLDFLLSEFHFNINSLLVHHLFECWCFPPLYSIFILLIINNNIKNNKIKKSNEDLNVNELNDIFKECFNDN